jgi:4-amino-4-deoxy-L-arabinose transferase-like glycosyltransferase
MLIASNKKFQAVILTIILLVFFFLRFYLIEQRTVFNWDQARDAQTVSQILSGKLTLIGPRVLGPDKFFLGPYFYYLLAPFYLVSKGSPLAMILFLVCYNAIFVISFWLIVKKLFSSKIALFALALWAVNPSFVSNDIISWNPVLVPLIVIITWYWCWLAQNQEKNKFAWPLLGFTLGLGVNFHFQIIFLIPFVIFFSGSTRKPLILKKFFYR